MNRSMNNPKIYYVVVMDIRKKKEQVHVYGNKQDAIEHYTREKFAQLFEYDCALQKTFLVPLTIEFK